jgi:hypothetical protein
MINLIIMKMIRLTKKYLACKNYAVNGFANRSAKETTRP